MCRRGSPTSNWRARPTSASLDTYYDTAALDLRRSGCSLRVRQSDGSVSPRLTLKGRHASERRAKARYEAEMEIAKLPGEIDDIRDLLRALDLLGELERLAEPRLGKSCTESARYATGVRASLRARPPPARPDLGRARFLTGPPQTRLEVEAHSDVAARLLDRLQPS